ncbi:MAG: hypothetical protein ACJAWL_002208 [Motiliproteus sp.]|jgi:hypothetical protein
MPLLSGTDNGHGSTLRAFFSLYFIGLERGCGAVLMVQLPFQAFQKAAKLLTRPSLSTVGACLQAIFWLAPAAGRNT